jgi:hypothetical protein
MVITFLIIKIFKNGFHHCKKRDPCIGHSAPKPKRSISSGGGSADPRDPPLATGLHTCTRSPVLLPCCFTYPGLDIKFKNHSSHRASATEFLVALTRFLVVLPKWYIQSGLAIRIFMGEENIVVLANPGHFWQYRSIGFTCFVWEDGVICQLDCYL